ncbi:hypothetical protein PoB_004404700 [Plakobranchus ocellatus]|uniref:Uncharacterized protein n=1 Tax=Plakobranchus ocellatus TaxID=259542 RepID=A0AAV4BDM1_9GAST|nr:hypothetical protein PoB_004404700 [Plakobranchus ocellatus]
MIISLAGSSVQPCYMDITEDGYLMCSTSKNSIARVEVGTGTVVFHKSGLQTLRQGQGAGGGSQTRNKSGLADLRADSLSTVPPTLPIEKWHRAI